MKTVTLFLLLSCLARSVSAGEMDGIVARHYPPILTERAAEDYLKERRQQAWVSITVAGKNYIVAAYSNGGDAAIELLEPAENDAIEKQLIRNNQLGYDPDLSLVDVDGDGQPEINVNYTLGPRGGSSTWIYRLVGGQLVRISPVDQHGNTELGFPDILDFGGGTMDLIDQANYGRRDDPIVQYAHYTLENGSFVARQPLDFYEVFCREKGAPVTQTEPFSIPASALGKPYRLTIVNGGVRGADGRVTAGTVKLNGVTIAGPSDFRQARASWTLPITLQAENMITVRLEGEKGSQIAVAIRHD